MMKSLLWLVDDGTCVVESTQTVDKPKHVSPHKGKAEAASSKITSDSVSKGYTSATSVRPSSQLVVGTLARICGTVKVWHEERHVNLNRIEQLRDLNEEHKHWELVAKWHREVYSRPFKIAPTVMEILPVMPVTPNRTGRKRLDGDDNGMSPGGISHASSVAGSPKGGDEGVVSSSFTVLMPHLTSFAVVRILGQTFTSLIDSLPGPLVKDFRDLSDVLYDNRQTLTITPRPIYNRKQTQKTSRCRPHSHSF